MSDSRLSPSSLKKRLRWGTALLTGIAAFSTAAPEANAFEIKIDEEDSVSIDISNTSTFAWRINNRNDAALTPDTATLNPQQYVDDNYGEWLNRLYVRSFYKDFSFGVRLDSAVYVNTMDRGDAQQLIVDKLGAPNLELENRFGRELNSRYTNFVYASKIYIAYKKKWFEATLGDFYAQLGRGLVFSVRKLDEVGVDTTVRGARVKLKTKIDGYRLSGTLMAGQVNPIRVDYPTGRVMHGSGSLLFPDAPRAGDLRYFRDDGNGGFEAAVDPARPSYLEDTVVGSNITFGPKAVQFELNGAFLFRQGNSEDLLRCTAAGGSSDDCFSKFPVFSTPESSRSHDQIRNFSASVRVPPIENFFDGYVEIAGQHQTDGRATALNSDGTFESVEDTFGFAAYANLNFQFGDLSASFEGKMYRSYFRLGANIDLVTPGFGGPEFAIVQYSLPPTTESVYVQQINSPDNCQTGGRLKLDWKVADGIKLFGWGSRYQSFSEVNPINNSCTESDELRSDTWDGVMGFDVANNEGKSHYNAWLGLRFIDRPIAEIANAELPVATDTFSRESYARYNLQQHLGGRFSLTLNGYAWRRYQPEVLPNHWFEGENLLALNFSPNWSFMAGFEYQTRPGLPVTYFSGAIQYRSKSQEGWFDRLTDSVRLFFGQRRAALRCVGGTCRVFPAFEGGRFELVSRF